MIKYFSSVFIFYFISLPIFFHQAGWAEDTSRPSWAGKMQELSQTLSDLILQVSSDQKYNSAEELPKIEKNAKKLADLAHDLKSVKIPRPDSDPSISILAGLFSEEATRAYQEFKRGNRSYARGILKTISGYCISCHTRNDVGPSFESLPAFSSLPNLNPLEKAEIYTATRQFDKGLAEYQSFISDSNNAQAKPFEWEKAIREYLVLSVRVKKDPEISLKIIEKVLETPKAPYYLKVQAKEWKDSISKWKKEMGKKFQSEEGLHSEAIRLIAAAKTLQKYPADRSGDIYYLRATSIIHEMLQKYPQGKFSAEAFLMAGLSYEALRDLNIWSLHEIYYAGCIHKQPHSSLAQNCYRFYEESIYLGYTGSGGSSLPDDELQRLDVLEKLAQPQNQVASPKIK